MTHAIAFNGFRQNNRWLTFVAACRLESCKHFIGVMITAVQTSYIFIAHAAYQFKQLRMLTKELFTYVSTIIRFISLILAIDGFFHDFTKNTLFVTRQKRIPIATPDQFDD